MSENRNPVAVGFTLFAATMMIVVGAFEAFQGLAAIVKKDYFVVAPNYVYKVNVTTWGLVHLVLGVVVAVAGVALLSGALWGRIVGVILAALVAVANFLWLPYYPVWSVIIIATCIVVMWALLAHGDEIED